MILVRNKQAQSCERWTTSLRRTKKIREECHSQKSVVLTAAEKVVCTKAFEKLTSEHGCVERARLKKLMTSLKEVLGKVPSDEQIEDLSKLVDFEDDGFIRLSEFFFLV